MNRATKAAVKQKLRPNYHPNDPMPLGPALEMRVYTGSGVSVLKVVTLFDHPDPAGIVIDDPTFRVTRGQPAVGWQPLLDFEPVRPQLWITSQANQQLIGMFDIPFVRDGVKWYRNREGFDVNYDSYSLDKRQADFRLTFFYQGRSRLAFLSNET